MIRVSGLDRAGFTRLSNLLSRRRVFNITVSLFIVFFALFAGAPWPSCMAAPAPAARNGLVALVPR